MIKAVARMFASAFGNSTGTGTVFHPTKICPECGSKLAAKSGVPNSAWICPNPDCPAQVRPRVVRWCSPAAMDIPGGDAQFAAKLVASGLARDVADLYQLKTREIAAIKGMDMDSAQRFFDAIAASRRREAWRLWFGLDIPGVGAEQARALSRQFPLADSVAGASEKQLAQAEGIGAETARGIVEWLNDPVNRKLLKRLSRAGLNFQSA